MTTIAVKVLDPRMAEHLPAYATAGSYTATLTVYDNYGVASTPATVGIRLT